MNNSPESQLLHAALADAQWCDKIVHCADGTRHQNWMICLYLPVEVGAADMSPQAALAAAIEGVHAAASAQSAQAGVAYAYPDSAETRYSPQGGREHPRHTRAQWREAVEHDATIAGYWAWVDSSLDEELEELAMQGYTVGARDRRANTHLPGRFMVLAPARFSDPQPGAQIALVGDDLDALVAQALPVT